MFPAEFRANGRSTNEGVGVEPRMDANEWEGFEPRMDTNGHE